MRWVVNLLSGRTIPERSIGDLGNFRLLVYEKDLSFDSVRVDFEVHSQASFVLVCIYRD